MKNILEEARINIPHFDDVWNSIKMSIGVEMKKRKPFVSDTCYRWLMTLYDVKVPSQMFFNNITIHLDLYLVKSEDQYQNIKENFNDSEVNPNMKLDRNGKINHIDIKMRIASSAKNMFNDILPDLYHELTHSYEYLGKLKKGASASNLRDNSTFDVSSLRQITSNPNLSALEKNLAVLFYFIDQSEYDGRLNTFYGEICNKDLTNKNVTEIITQTRVWKNIAFLHNVIYYMNQVKEPADQRKLIMIGNIMNRRKQQNTYNDYSTLLKDVSQKYNKLKNDSYKDFAEIVQEVITNKKR